MYSQIGSILLAILGLVLLLSPETLFSKDTSKNGILQKIQEYHQIVGVILVGIAYYLYTYTPPPVTSDFQSTTEKSISETTSVTNVSPPTYDQATS